MGAALEAVAGLLIGAALVALHSGGLRLDLFGSSLSVRTVSRPLIAAALIIAARLWLLRRVGSTRLKPHPTDPLVAGARDAAINSIARTLCASLIAAGVIGWLVHLSPTCGGADSYGYVSAAERLLDGELIVDEPLAAALPFPNGILAATPLGYTPTVRRANASVPVYPLGLPVLMAAGIAMFGPVAAFYVAPFVGVILLIAGYLVAREWYHDREAALLAAALLALHPLVFTYSLQPMSDVPAAAALMIAVYVLSRASPQPILGGAAAALAVMIRPALAPPAFALAIVPMITLGWRGLRTAAAYAVCLASGALLQAWTQWYLYGSAFTSGYGAVSSLFSLTAFTTNLKSHAHWGLLTMGPVWLGGLAIGLIGSGRAPRAVLLTFAAGIGAPYLFYFPYDHWETLRFLLPLLAVATIFSAWGLLIVARRVAGHAGGSLIATIIAALVGASWISWLSANHVFEMPEHEARHRVVGEIVGTSTPPDAVVLALQHSGSVRYYARRQTLNWDRIPDGAFESTVDALRRLGREVYVLIDSPEELAMFRARHGNVLYSGAWLPAGQWRNVQMFEAAEPDLSRRSSPTPAPERVR